MDGEARVGAGARRWDIAIGVVAAAGLVAAVAVAAAVALPPSLANLSSEVSDGRAPFSLGDAAVVVPADWLVTRDAEDAITVRTPDGALLARMDTVTALPSDVVEEAAPDAIRRSELLASGLTAVHADVDGGGIVAGVGSAESAHAVRVVIEVRPADGRPAGDYRAAAGQLLEGVRP